jgi:hypothetical protein
MQMQKKERYLSRLKYIHFFYRKLIAGAYTVD